MEAGHAWEPAGAWHDEFEGETMAVLRVENDMNPSFLYATVAPMREVRNEDGTWRDDVRPARIVELPKYLFDHQNSQMREATLGWIG